MTLGVHVISKRNFLSEILGGYKMETMQRDTEIIIIDIRDSVEEFRCSRTPKDVRKLYSNFLLQTKQLTDIMRKEYHLLTGRKWEASKFTKWDAVSDFFIVYGTFIYMKPLLEYVFMLNLIILYMCLVILQYVCA
jgi:hypothetical protein